MKFLAMLVLFSQVGFSQFSYALDGSAKLSTMGAGYDVRLEGDKLTGSINGFGNASGLVQMQKVNGVWQGSFGTMRVIIRNLTVSGDRTQFQLVMLPLGINNFTFEKTSKGDFTARSMLSSGLMASGTVSADGHSLFSGNQYANMGLNQTSAGNYSGVWTMNGRMKDSMDLSSSGKLTPLETAKDPVLFTLLYVMPLNFSR